MSLNMPREIQKMASAVLIFSEGFGGSQIDMLQKIPLDGAKVVLVHTKTSETEIPNYQSDQLQFYGKKGEKSDRLQYKHVRGTTPSLASRLAMTQGQPRPNC